MLMMFVPVAGTVAASTAGGVSADGTASAAATGDTVSVTAATAA
jgi:hypothetical protein